MNLFIKTLAGTFAALALQATPLLAAETEPLRLAMTNQGCRPGTSPVQLDDGTTVCGEVIPVTGGSGGGDKPVIILPNPGGGPAPTGAGTGAEADPYGGGGGIGGNPAPEKEKTKAQQRLEDAKYFCEVSEGKWKLFKETTVKNGRSKTVSRQRCEYPSYDSPNEIIYSAYDSAKGEFFRYCRYTLERELIKCRYVTGSQCDRRGKQKPKICAEPDPYPN